MTRAAILQPKSAGNPDFIRTADPVLLRAMRNVARHTCGAPRCPHLDPEERAALDAWYAGVFAREGMPVAPVPKDKPRPYEAVRPRPPRPHGLAEFEPGEVPALPRRRRPEERAAGRGHPKGRPDGTTRRDAVILRHFYDFTTAEIADWLQISPKTVGTHLRRAGLPPLRRRVTGKAA